LLFPFVCVRLQQGRVAAGHRKAGLARATIVRRTHEHDHSCGGVEVENPLELALELLAAYSSYEAYDPSGPASLDERDLRMTNRGGARISAAEIAAIRERRGKIERALHEIRPDASLTDATNAIPWIPLTRLFDARDLPLQSSADLALRPRPARTSLAATSGQCPFEFRERNRAAQELFAPLAATYDRYARLLSLGQDPRWCSFLVSQVEVPTTSSSSSGSTEGA